MFSSMLKRVGPQSLIIAPTQPLIAPCSCSNEHALSACSFYYLLNRYQVFKIQKIMGEFSFL